MADDCHLNCINKLPFLVVVFIGNPTYSVLHEERESESERERIAQAIMSGTWSNEWQM